MGHVRTPVEPTTEVNHMPRTVEHPKRRSLPGTGAPGRRRRECRVAMQRTASPSPPSSPLLSRKLPITQRVLQALTQGPGSETQEAIHPRRARPQGPRPKASTQDQSSWSHGAPCPVGHISTLAASPGVAARVSTCPEAWSTPGKMLTGHRSSRQTSAECGAALPPRLPPSLPSVHHPRS